MCDDTLFDGDSFANTKLLAGARPEGQAKNGMKHLCCQQVDDQRALVRTLLPVVLHGPRRVPRRRPRAPIAAHDQLVSPPIQKKLKHC